MDKSACVVGEPCIGGVVGLRQWCESPIFGAEVINSRDVKPGVAVRASNIWIHGCQDGAGPACRRNAVPDVRPNGDISTLVRRGNGDLNFVERPTLIASRVQSLVAAEQPVWVIVDNPGVESRAS